MGVPGWAVRMRGGELGVPCRTRKSQLPEQAWPGLVRRGGLRTAIFNEGEIQAGDAIALED